jgi:hypothetical protein
MVADFGRFWKEFLTQIHTQVDHPTDPPHPQPPYVPVRSEIYQKSELTPYLDTVKDA